MLIYSALFEFIKAFDALDGFQQMGKVVRIDKELKILGPNQIQSQSVYFNCF